MSDALRNTLAHLRLCQQARAAGYPVAFTTDPAWLVEQAINRRAGWPDDPSCSRGSARPAAGRYPSKAEGDTYRHLRQLADKINTPRLIVRPQECGEWRGLIESRIPDRLHRED
jgi:hypothetical protein